MPALLEDDLPAELPVTEEQVLAEICKESFEEFCKEFWSVVPGVEKLRWNWHMSVFCDELQNLAERVFANLPREHDLVTNVSPGTSKSTIYSILYPAWIWARMPRARVITASHTETLVVDLAAKARDVIKSEKYRACFPDVQIRSDKDAKSEYATTVGGERRVCTVAGKTPLGFHAHFIIVDDPIDPQKVLSDLERKTAASFMTEWITNRKVDKAVTATILIMQRLGVGDPTEVMLEQAKKEGAAKVRHVCLPSELFKDEEGKWIVGNVSPPELAGRYVDGLMDPIRLSHPVLNENRAKGELFYSTQFLQRPFVRGGGMFKEIYFNQRVKAAPYVAKRVRSWDRAASTEDSACNTAGVLICRDSIGNFYIEDCVVGKWNPDERDDVMIATAQRDRLKYGPSHEPDIYIEHEPGSSGVDAYKATARKLAGFRVYPNRPTGDKETRAEPWSSQLAAKNVYVVDNGQSQGAGEATWDIQAYVNEHCSFPKGLLKDMVDSSADAFLRLLSQVRVGSSGMRILHGKHDKHTGPRIILGTEKQFGNLGIEQRVISVRFLDPNEEVKTNTQPLFVNCLDQLTLNFADITPSNLQDLWHQPLQPWNRLPSELIMSQSDGKKLWSFLAKVRSPVAEIFAFIEESGDRSLSIAQAVCDIMRLDRSKAIWSLHEPDNSQWDGDAKNDHCFAIVRSTRGLVL